MNIKYIDKNRLYDKLHLCFEDFGIITKYKASINCALEFTADTMWYCEKIEIIPQNDEAIVYFSKLPAEEEG